MSHSNEIKLLIICLNVGADERNIDTIHSLVTKNLNWQKILKVAKHNDIASLFYYNLKQICDERLIPSEIYQELKKTYHGINYQNIVFLEELKKILTLFGNAQIDVIPLKGASLIGKIWKNAALRPMADIDVLVRQQDIGRAEKLLSDSGYIANEAFHSKEWYRKNHFHIAPYFNPNNRVPIEVHHNVLSPDESICLDMYKIWQHAETDTMGEITTKCLCTEDMFIHLCLHLFVNSTCVRTIKHFLDIVRFLNYYEKSIDWHVIEKEATEKGFINAIYYSLYTANILLGATLDNRVMARFKRKSSKNFLEDYLIKKMIENSVIFDCESYYFPSHYHQMFFTQLFNETTMLHKLDSFMDFIFQTTTIPLSRNSGHILFKIKKFVYYTFRITRLIFKFICNMINHIMNRDLKKLNFFR